MSWLGANTFFVIILLLCVGMHLFHGHGGHGNDGGDDEPRRPRSQNDHH